MDSIKKPHILIAGAGIGGLVLAQCLRAKGHPFTIFERDAGAAARSQGWAIALHTMLKDLVDAMPDDMPSLDETNHLLPFDHLPAQLSFLDARNKDQPVRKFMIESEPASKVGYGPGRVIRANRDLLRAWLTTNIDVQWGKQVSSFEQSSSNGKGPEVTLHFTDGTSAKGDILVGAEGVRSAVREGLIPNAPLEKVPECFLTGEITLSKDAYERQLAISHSAYAIAGSNFHIFVGLNRVAKDGQSAAYYWDLIWADDQRAVPNESHWIDSASQEELYDFAVDMTKDVPEDLTEIIRLSGPSSMITPPLILRDMVLEEMPASVAEKYSHVTLLGDAAHAMTPFRGEGGCQAIRDALNLAKVLTNDENSDWGKLVAGLREYEKEMLKRGSEAVRGSRAAGNAHGNQRQEIRTAWGQKVRPA